MEDKAVDEMLNLFSTIGDRFILVKPNQERALNPEELAKRLSVFDKPVDIIPDIPDALETAEKISNSNDLICITGSIFTVSEAKQLLANDPVG